VGDPWRGWKEVLSRTYDETLNDRLFYVAAGVAFFVLLAIFPAISALVPYLVWADFRNYKHSNAASRSCSSLSFQTSCGSSD
jgi:uncharacterized BrkB/YihY/UPF0761 family membrane protein